MNHLLSSLFSLLSSGLFRIASDTALWSQGYPEDSFSPLAEALTVVSTLIQATDSNDTVSATSTATATVSAFRTELSQLGEAYAHALLSIVRRAPSHSSELPANKAMNLLCQSVKALFETPKHTTPSSSSSSVKATKLTSFYHYSSTQTRYLLLDVFAHTPFEDVLSATKSVLSAISSASTSAEEQRYFLRIAFER